MEYRHAVPRREGADDPVARGARLRDAIDQADVASGDRVQVVVARARGAHRHERGLRRVGVVHRLNGERQRRRDLLSEGAIACHGAAKGDAEVTPRMELRGGQWCDCGV